LRQFEPRTEVPDASVFGPLPQRLAPHIYREEEIVDLLAAARGLAPTGGLRPVTYETLFGLIASVGLRLSEALHLLDADVDLKLDRLTVRQTKFAKSRQLPIHTSVVGPLRRYRRIRNRHLKVTADMPFFVSKTGKVLSSRQVQSEGLEGQLDGPKVIQHEVGEVVVIRFGMQKSTGVPAGRPQKNARDRNELELLVPLPQHQPIE
jgi:integrase